MTTVLNWINEDDAIGRGDSVRSVINGFNLDCRAIYRDVVTELIRHAGYDAEDVALPVELLLSLVADHAYQIGYMTAAQPELSLERRRYVSRGQTDDERQYIGTQFDAVVRQTFAIDVPLQTLLTRVRIGMNRVFCKLYADTVLETLRLEQQLPSVLRAALPYVAPQVLLTNADGYTAYLRVHCGDLSVALEQYNGNAFTARQLQQFKRAWMAYGQTVIERQPVHS